MFFSLTRRRLLLALGAACASRVVFAADKPLLLGVVPYLSARKLAELYEPLRAFLEREFARPAMLESAPSYAVYLERCAAGEYDVIATSPYFGRISEREHGYAPLARPLTDLEPLLVVMRDSPLSDVRELRGKVVTTSDALANLSLAARRYFAEIGMPPGREITIKPMGSHANSLAALAHGDSAAAIVSVTTLKQIGGDWNERVRVLVRLRPTPPLLYLAHRRLGEERIARLQQNLFRFANETPEGKAFFQALGHDGLKPVTAADLAALDPFVDDLKRMMATR
ncbi:MAG: phosphate/phosphite/phosphonate ABC transporter substrate-binding protein [Rhodocyclaceae bacterium]|nr:phosphate/phosphite/phosphonate ABC transporter substrate-binding protein [Rhodocyclaceae bacterium]